MENAYGIGVKNRYELFYDDEEDPIERIRQQEQELERKKTVAEKALKGPSKGSGATTIAKTGGKQANPAATVPAKKKDLQSGRISDAPTATDQAPRSRPPKPPGGERAPSKFPRGGGGNVANDDQRDLEQRNNRRNREDRPPPPPPAAGSEFRDRGGDGEMRRIGRGGRGGGRGGPGRGRARGGMFDGRGKREFDRQSGSDKSPFSSGVKATEKREGSGAHNWGNSKDDIDNSFNTPNEEPAETAERSGDEETVAENQERKEGEEQTIAPDGTEDGIKLEDEANKEMTLDEWKREQEQKRSVPKFNLRKPGEGEDNGQWQKKVFVLKKKENEEDDDEETEEEEDEIRRGRQKQVVDIAINFTDSRRGRGRGRGGPRGGMGGPGGRGGRGGPGGFNRGGIRDGGGPAPRGDREVDSWADRGPRDRDREGGKGKGTQQSAPRVDDWNDFPSLVAA